MRHTDVATAKLFTLIDDSNNALDYKNAEHHVLCRFVINSGVVLQVDVPPNLPKHHILLSGGFVRHYSF